MPSFFGTCPEVRPSWLCEKRCSLRRRCLGSLVKPFVLLAYLNEHCSDLTSHAPGPPLSEGGQARRSLKRPATSASSCNLVSVALPRSVR